MCLCVPALLLSTKHLFSMHEEYAYFQERLKSFIQEFRVVYLYFEAICLGWVQDCAVLGGQVPGAQAGQAR